MEEYNYDFGHLIMRINALDYYRTNEGDMIIWNNVTHEIIDIAPKK